jgi:hypothetical protein
LKKGEGSPYAEVDFKIMQFFSEKGSSSFTCDSLERSLIAGSLHFYRMEEVCRIVLFSNQIKTNKLGLGVFNELLIKRGPQGSYR